jgi:hypothetical protein
VGFQKPRYFELYTTILVWIRWVQDGCHNSWSVVQKWCVERCTEILTFCEGQEKEVIESIVMGDETMVLYHDPV